jgi:hypothetical protein
MQDVQVIRLRRIEDLGDDNLRTQAEAWSRVEIVEAGVAITVPDNGRPMEGFYRITSRRGVVLAGIEPLSEWIEADSLEEMFRIYASWI